MSPVRTRSLAPINRQLQSEFLPEIENIRAFGFHLVPEEEVGWGDLRAAVERLRPGCRATMGVRGDTELFGASVRPPTLIADVMVPTFLRREILSICRRSRAIGVLSRKCGCARHQQGVVERRYERPSSAERGVQVPKLL
jgi:hypothetical protein